MAIAHVQDSSAVVTASGNPETASVAFGSNVTAGSMLVVFIAQFTSSVRTYTISDNVVGSTGWTKAKGIASSQEAEVWYRANHTGGSVTISVTHGLSSTVFVAGAAEFSGLGATVTVDASDSLAEGSNLNSHTCSTSGITSANSVVAACSGVLGAIGTECNPGTGYAEVTSGFVNNSSCFQWKLFPSGCTSETGAWASTGTARQGRSVIALLSGVSLQSASVTGAGGGVAGGAAVALRGSKISVAGGGIGGGSATSKRGVVSLASGGAVAGGSAVLLRGRVAAAIGGGIAGGSAAVVKGKIATASGGAVAGGTATTSIGRSFSGSGGAVAGGSATTSSIGLQAVSFSASGGAIAGGEADIGRSANFFGDGGGLAGGSATVTRTLGVSYLATGGAVAGGTATTNRAQSFISSGGAVAGGIAAIALSGGGYLTDYQIIQVLNTLFEGGYTVSDILKMALAHALGRQVVTFGPKTTTVVYRDIPDTLNRLTMTEKGGARISVDKDLS